MSLSSIRHKPTQFFLEDWSLIKVTGADRETFFQGQVTNDLESISINQAQLTARLNRTGKLQSIFFIAKLSDCLYIICPKDLTQKIKDDFEKFIIMDEVTLEVQNFCGWIQLNSFLLNEKQDGLFFDFIFYGLNARFVLDKKENLELTDLKELEKIRILNGWPIWGKDIGESHLINDSYLNELAISYKKGCFLGQETVAKIENNRGPAYYPVLLKTTSTMDLKSKLNNEFTIEDRKAGELHYQVDSFLQATLFRDYRVVGRELLLNCEGIKIKVTVLDLPFYKTMTRQQVALELYHLGVEIFQAGKLEEAMITMKKALAFDPSLADAYESLGVMLGRIEKFEEAITWMDKLLCVNPQSVMAHTNKSLFLMKLGKIEEAEAEKGFATVKSFAFFGEEAKQKKQILEEQKKKEEEILRREKMFMQVLEIDEEDTIALYGMADIFYQRKEYIQAIKNLEKVITVDPKYSTAYLMLGKSYEAATEIEKARITYQAGIIVASKRGDMMPANEMQSRLNQLVVSSGLN